MNVFENDIWQDPEIIEIKDELIQEKVAANLFVPYGSIGPACTYCY